MGLKNPMSILLKKKRTHDLVHLLCCHANQIYNFIKFVYFLNNKCLKRNTEMTFRGVLETLLLNCGEQVTNYPDPFKNFNKKKFTVGAVSSLWF